MSQVAYVDGQYLPHHPAAVHIEDPGYRFADGVYEVMAVVGGSLLDEGPHLTRLARSLAELQIPAPMSNAALHIVTREVVRRNNVRDGIVYVQITRGVVARDHSFPKFARPVLVVTSRRKRPVDPRAIDNGIAVITIPDIRRKQRAKEAGAFEAWQVDREGGVSEGASTNAWIVTRMPLS